MRLCNVNANSWFYTFPPLSPWNLLFDHYSVVCLFPRVPFLVPLCFRELQVKKRFLISGGGAAETEVAMQLTEWAKTQTGMRGYCIRAYGEGEFQQKQTNDLPRLRDVCACHSCQFLAPNWILLDRCHFPFLKESKLRGMDYGCSYSCGSSGTHHPKSAVFHSTTNVCYG